MSPTSRTQYSQYSFQQVPLDGVRSFIQARVARSPLLRGLALTLVSLALVDILANVIGLSPSLSVYYLWMQHAANASRAFSQPTVIALCTQGFLLLVGSLLIGRDRRLWLPELGRRENNRTLAALVLPIFAVLAISAVPLAMLGHPSVYDLRVPTAWRVATSAAALSTLLLAARRFADLRGKQGILISFAAPCVVNALVLLAVLVMSGDSRLLEQGLFLSARFETFHAFQMLIGGSGLAALCAAWLWSRTSAREAVLIVQPSTPTTSGHNWDFASDLVPSIVAKFDPQLATKVLAFRAVRRSAHDTTYELIDSRSAFDICESAIRVVDLQSFHRGAGGTVALNDPRGYFVGRATYRVICNGTITNPHQAVGGDALDHVMHSVFDNAYLHDSIQSVAKHLMAEQLDSNVPSSSEFLDKQEHLLLEAQLGATGSLAIGPVLSLPNDIPNPDQWAHLASEYAEFATLREHHARLKRTGDRLGEHKSQLMTITADLGVSLPHRFMQQWTQEILNRKGPAVADDVARIFAAFRFEFDLQELRLDEKVDTRYREVVATLGKKTTEVANRIGERRRDMFQAYLKDATEARAKSRELLLKVIDNLTGPSQLEVLMDSELGRSLMEQTSLTMEQLRQHMGGKARALGTQGSEADDDRSEEGPFVHAS